MRRGMLLLVASSGFFGLMALLVKLASTRLPSSETAMLRFIFGFLPVLVFSEARRRSFVWQRLDLLFYRGFFGGFAALAYFVAIAHVPVGLATLLNFLSPIFAGVYAAIFASEPLRARVILPFVVALSGVVLVVRAHAGDSELFLGFGVWELVGLLSAVLSGAAVTSIRVARRTENSWAIFASLSLFGIVLSAPFALWQWIWPTPREWILLALIGMVSLAGQLVMTYAYRWVETLIAGVISQLSVITAMVLGAVFLAEAVTAQSFLGTVLTLAGVSAVMVINARAAATVSGSRG